MGSDKCDNHGGKVPMIRSAGGRYSKYLKGNFAINVKEQLEHAAHDHLDLSEEIALSRTMLGESMKLVQCAMEAPSSSNETKTTAVQLMNQAVEQVADICAKAAAIETRMKDVVTWKQLALLLEQVRAAVKRSLPEELADTVITEIEASLKLPSDGRADPYHGKTPQICEAVLDYE